MPAEEPREGAMRTEYSPNARAKCQICRLKIAKGSWRVQRAIADPYHPHSDGTPRVTWESGHASCYMEYVTKPVCLANSTQSMPFYGTTTNPIWAQPPVVDIPATEQGEAIKAVLAALDEAATMDQSLPSEELRGAFSAVVATVVTGTDALNENDKTLLETFCLHQRLTEPSRELLKISEARELELPQPEDSGDPLKSKFTQYSPNS